MLFRTLVHNFSVAETASGDVVIIYNTCFYNKSRLHEYVEIYKMTMIFLTVYLSDFNPVEHVRANMKDS